MNYTASLDKIKISGKIKPFPLSEYRFINAWIDEIAYSTCTDIVIRDGLWVEDETHLGKSFGYRYWVSLGLRSDDDASLYLSWCWQAIGTFKRDFNRFELEYNPNKSQKLYDSFTHSFAIAWLDIKSYDIALDFLGRTTADLMFLPDSHASYMSYGTFCNKTYYLNPKSSHGRIKAYNKHIERKDDDVRLRVEISSRYNPFFSSRLSDSDVDALNKMVRNLNAVTFFNQSITDPTLYLLSKVDNDARNEALALFSEVTRKKYKRLLKELNAHPLEFDSISLNTLICELLHPYRQYAEVISKNPKKYIPSDYQEDLS